MTKRADQLQRIEAATSVIREALDKLDGITEILGKVSALGGQVAGLAETVQQVMVLRAEHDAGVAADAKRAATASEAAFAGVQALAQVATAKPGLDELAAAVHASTEAVRQVHQAVTVPQAAPDPEPAGGKPRGKT